MLIFWIFKLLESVLFQQQSTKCNLHMIKNGIHFFKLRSIRYNDNLNKSIKANVNIVNKITFQSNIDFILSNNAHIIPTILINRNVLYK
jgi:hypothetical protein